MPDGKVSDKQNPGGGPGSVAPIDKITRYVDYDGTIELVPIYEDAVSIKIKAGTRVTFDFKTVSVDNNGTARAIRIATNVREA